MTPPATITRVCWGGSGVLREDHDDSPSYDYSCLLGGSGGLREDHDDSPSYDYSCLLGGSEVLREHGGEWLAGQLPEGVRGGLLPRGS